ncbi:hypothetical protein FISHEDRAFT_7253, partial [Fistulina hepatica ATCC 64428]
FHPHLPGRGPRLVGKVIGTTMWFFIFYRLREDGGKLLGQHPWDTHGHGHEAH